MPFAVALLLAPAFPNVVRAPLCMVVTQAPPGRGYVRRVLVSLNQTLNALTGGEADETLSSRWGRARRRGSKAAKVVCAALEKIQPCHCASAIERDETGAPLAHQLHGDGLR